MKYNMVEYSFDGESVEIVKVAGYNTTSDIPEMVEGVSRAVLESLEDVRSLGEPVFVALAKFKGVDATPEAVWEHFNPTPKAVTGDSVAAPKWGDKTKRERKKKSETTENNDLQSDANKTTSEESTTEVDMDAKEKAKIAKAKEKEKAAAAKLKAKEKADKEKAKADAAKLKEKEKAEKLKAKAEAAKAKEKEKAAKAKEREKNGKAPRKPRGPAGPYGEKTLAVKKLLTSKNGCTRKDILDATGWPTVSVQAMAKNLKLKLSVKKEPGKLKVYFGKE